MMSQGFPVPFLIKEEALSDSEEVYCRLCHKGFASTIALRNHASMDHTEAFENGDPTVWTKTPDDPVYKPGGKPKQKSRASGILSTMSPTNLGDLACTDISYIIVKSETPLTENTKKLVKKEPKRIVIKKAKPVQAITGPFECLEASPLGADGVCHQIFFSCCEYSLHSRHEHARKRRAMRCQVCERTLPSRRAEPGEAAYDCETCSSSFHTDEELERHMRQAHVKEKPYACGVCHKRFTQQGGVLQHMRMHTGERPFPCTMCNKAFTQKSGLDQHMRTHTKHKPYRCVVCSKAFIQSVHLKQHMRTHTNVAPFQCGICDKRFKQSSHLNYHLKNHNPFNMSEEERNKYEQLVGQITQDATQEVDQELEQEVEQEVYEGDEVEIEILPDVIENDPSESQEESYIIEAADDMDTMLEYQE